jgi:hypothetical protein
VLLRLTYLGITNAFALLRLKGATSQFPLRSCQNGAVSPIAAARVRHSRRKRPPRKPSTPPGFRSADVVMAFCLPERAIAAEPAFRRE